MTETDDQSALDTPPSTRGMRFGRLDTLAGVLSEMGRLYRAARRDELPAVDASRLAYMLSQIRRAVEGADIERRLAALETAVTEATK